MCSSKKRFCAGKKLKVRIFGHILNCICTVREYEIIFSTLNEDKRSYSHFLPTFLLLFCKFLSQFPTIVLARFYRLRAH